MKEMINHWKLRKLLQKSYPNKKKTIKDKNDGSRQIALQPPMGQYDVRTIIDKLPNDQKPELLIVKADATRVNHPTHITDLPIPAGI